MAGNQTSAWRVLSGRDLVLFVVLLAIGVAGRLLPHLPNFIPIAAAALFGGFAMRSRFLAVCLPILTMLASDAVLGFYKTPIMIVVYASLMVPVVLGIVLPRRFAPLRLAGSSVAGSLFFYLTTNAAVWAFGTLYPRDWTGLVASYAAGYPYMRMTVVGDLVYAFAMFGAYHAIRAVAASRKAAPAALLDLPRPV